MVFVLCICRHCGFITYGERPDAEHHMIRHLVRKHGVWYPKPGYFRTHYIMLIPPKEPPRSPDTEPHPLMLAGERLRRDPVYRRAVFRYLHMVYRPRGFRP